MNERIQQLAEEASLYARSDNSSMLFENYHNRYTEKFAELIVRECISQSWTVSELEHKGNVISECSKRMRKHFGVEE